MMQLTKPDDASLLAILDHCADADFTYAQVAGTQQNESPSSYDLDHNRIMLGQGEEMYEKACAALAGWRMFPPGWTNLFPAAPPQLSGQNLVMVARVLGIYWVNPCRVVYRAEEEGATRRSGFAYGTLPGHVEQGEERFLVEMKPDGSVWYDLLAFSRPSEWYTKLGYPLARWFQHRFVRHSQRSMLAAVNERTAAASTF